MSMTRMLVSLSMLFVCFGPAFSQDEVETTTHHSSAKDYSIALPSDWTVTVRKDDDAVLAFDLDAPQGIGTTFGNLFVYWVKNIHRPEIQPFAEKERMIKLNNADDSSVEMKPLPHLRISFPHEDKRYAKVFAYRVVKSRGFSVVAVFDEAGWETVRGSIFKAVASLDTTLPPWPADPDGYKKSQKGGFKYLRHRRYKGKTSSVEKIVAAELKVFTKRHGKISFDKAWPPAILLHKKRGDFAELLEKGAPVGNDFQCAAGPKRLYAVSVGKKKSAGQAEFARELNRLLFVLRYGNLNPSWFSVGEGEVAYERGLTGKPLPVINAARHGKLPRTPRPFAEVVGGLEQENYDDFRHHCLIYLTLFRHGDSRYQKAFGKFLKDFGTTHDWDAATRQHLLGFDDEQFRADAEAIVKKFYKPKK